MQGAAGMRLQDKVRYCVGKAKVTQQGNIKAPRIIQRSAMFGGLHEICMDLPRSSREMSRGVKGRHFVGLLYRCRVPGKSVA